MNIGGALASPGQAAALGVSSNIIYIQNTGVDGNTSYPITASTGSGGYLTSGNYLVFQGYTSSRSLGNTDPRPRIKVNASTVTAVNGPTMTVSGLYFDGNAQTAAKASAGALFVRCYFTSFNTVSSGSNTFVYAESTANSAIVLAGSCAYCEAHANTATGIATGGSLEQIVDSISYGNTGSTSHGFSAAGTGSIFKNDVAYNNGGNGFNQTALGTVTYINCHAGSHAAGRGFLLLSDSVMLNCSIYNNNTANSIPANSIVVGLITLGTSPFTNSAGGDFSLNTTSGGGASLRAAGYPSVFPAGLTASYLDVGAAQHQDTGVAPAVQRITGYVK